MEEILLTDELKMLRKTMKSFIKEHVVPAEKSAGGTIERLPLSVVLQLQSKAKQNGFWLLGSKKEWGGPGLTRFEQVVLEEEATQHRLGFHNPGAGAFGRDLPCFLSKCTTEQYERFMKPAILTGNGCYMALWEPNESDELQNLLCHAQKKGDTWVIQGKKSYVTNVERADFGIVLVRCLTESGDFKPTLFLLERDDAIEKNEKLLLDVHSCYELTFNDFEIDDTRRIGNVGEGVQMIEEWLTESQILLAARCIGIAKKALQFGINYASLRITRGKHLSEYPSIRTMLAASYAELQAARLSVWNAAIKLDRNAKDCKPAVQIAKLIATETASKIIDRVFQIHGGAGFTRDFPLERWYKELRISRLDLRSTETLHETIADFLLENK
ncbi:acyl-CoA dehydrogenase family protein [Aneurinibacillus terranovensis]|uniref:acyl-CoA dehydrogenase family protein n=1 Tax=Aneurinibacillus terranovensis TaxID=278991 RepID=UPI00040C786D|nr:acyl-CoA dehydrogenase family protein [Aneurinibacillus terranovensis]